MLPQLRKHAGLLSWTAADKVLFFGYGIVTWLQIRALAPEEYALAAQLITLQAWIAIIAEGSILQSVIQYGHSSDSRNRAFMLASLLHIAFTMGIAGIIALSGGALSALFNEPRFVEVASTLPLVCALGIPRSIALKVLQRELRARDVFLINAAWMGSMTVLTLVKLALGQLRSYHDLVSIAASGLAISSAVGIVLGHRWCDWSLAGHLSLRTVLRFSSPQALMMALSTSVRQLDIFLVQPFFGTRLAGIYNAAKMLYRVFETGADAVLWLMYPTAVRYIHESRKHELSQLIARALVLQWAVVIVAVAVLEAGGTQLIVGILGGRYAEASVMFNLMVLAALFLPLAMLQAIHLAFGLVDRLLAITVLGLATALVAYVTAGLVGAAMFAALGVVVYSAVTGSALWRSAQREGLVTASSIAHAIAEVAQLLHSRIRRSPSVDPSLSDEQ